MELEIQPVSFATASSFVAQWHRHCKPPVGHLWSIGLFAGLLDLRGVAIIGRPVSRCLDNGRTVEITRLATDGTRNACSMLYGAVTRQARLRGYHMVITYTLATETGASVRAANFTRAAYVRGETWDRPSRHRRHRPVVDRVRWEWS